MSEGAKYDGTSPGEDWTVLLRKSQQVTMLRPPILHDCADHEALEFQPGRAARSQRRGYHERLLSGRPPTAQPEPADGTG